MHRFTSPLSFTFLSFAVVAGCFGNGLGIFDSEPLVDEYTGFEQSIRGNYALGAPVRFQAELEDDMSGTVAIEVPDQFTVVERGADFVSTIAETAGRGQVTLTLDGDRLGRYDTRVAAVDRLAFRRVYNWASRESYDRARVFHRSAPAEVVVDFYAGDTRLYGRAITTAPDSEDWSVRTTTNNDRVELLSRLAGVYEIPLSVNGEAVGQVTFERVEEVASFEINVQGPDDVRSVRASGTDAEGRPVIVAPSWTVDGSPVTGLSPLESIGIGDEGGLVEATLDGETVTLSVPPL